MSFSFRTLVYINFVMNVCMNIVDAVYAAYKYKNKFFWEMKFLTKNINW